MEFSFFTCPRQAALTDPSLYSPPFFHFHRLTPPLPIAIISPAFSSSSSPSSSSSSSHSLSQQGLNSHTKEGSGLVALWWMHFHRPISVILEKQVSVLILLGLYSFTPLPPLLYFHLLPSSPRPLGAFHEGHSLILLSTNADPMNPSPCLIYSQPGPSLEAKNPPPTHPTRSRTGPQNKRRPFFSMHPHGRPLACPPL